MMGSVRTRWIFSFLLLIALTLGLEAAALLRWVRGDLEKQLQARLNSQNALLATLVEQSLSSTGSLKTACQLALTPPPFDPETRVQVSGLDGKIVYDSAVSGPPSGVLKPQALNPAGESSWETRDALHASRPLHQVGQMTGFIETTENKSALLPVLNALTHALIGAAAGALALAIILSVLVSGSMVRPLQELEKVTRQIAKGEWDKRVNFTRSDELGELAGAVNAMAEGLKEQFAQLQEEKITLQALFASMIDGLIVLDEKGNVKFLNPAAEKALRINSGTAFGKPLDSIWPLDEVVSMAREGIEEKKILSREISLPYNVLKVFVIPMLPATGSSGILLFRDITEVRELEKARTEFLGQISHELRTPLTIIKGYVVTLLDDPRVSAIPEVPKILLRTEEEADRLTRLVEELLEFSRLKGGKSVLTFAPLSLKDLVSDTVEGFRPHAERYRIHLEFDSGGEVPQVLGDAGRLKQVVLNLLDNAVKFTPPGGRIAVMVALENGKVTLTVSDTGSGIPEGDLPHIFERFFQGEKKGREKGWGLGLPIVKEIVDAHGAEMKIESAAGKGTRVVIRFPPAAVV